MEAKFAIHISGHSENPITHVRYSHDLTHEFTAKGADRFDLIRDMQNSVNALLMPHSSWDTISMTVYELRDDESEEDSEDAPT